MAKIYGFRYYFYNILQNEGIYLRVKNILDYKIMTNLFQFSRQSWNNWKKEERPIIALLEKYFTKEDLEEFLKTGEIVKFESLDKNFICERLPEILKLLTKYKTENLAIALAKSLESHGIISGTSKRLHKTKEKEDFLRDLERILSDLSHEISKGEDTNFQAVIKSFNNEIGFDFNADDKSIVYHIITRYRVYNTLYDLDV